MMSGVGHERMDELRRQRASGVATVIQAALVIAGVLCGMWMGKVHTEARHLTADANVRAELNSKLAYCREFGY